MSSTSPTGLSGVSYVGSDLQSSTAKLLESLGIKQETCAVPDEKVSKGVEELVEASEKFMFLTAKEVREKLEEKFKESLNQPKTIVLIKSELRRCIQAKNEKPAPASTDTCKDPRVLSGAEAREGVRSDAVQPRGPSELLDTRHDPGSGIPLIFSKRLETSKYVPVLAELSGKPTAGGRLPAIDISGDSGVVGRVEVVDSTGQTFAPASSKSGRRRSKGKDWVHQASRALKDGGFIRVDLKGDIFNGNIAKTDVSYCAITVHKGKEARVQAVFNSYLQGVYQGNVMTNIRGEVLGGDQDAESKSALTPTRDGVEKGSGTTPPVKKRKTK